MENFNLTAAQVERVICSESLSGCVSEWLRGRGDGESFKDSWQWIVSTYSQEELLKAATYAYTMGAAEIESFDDPETDDYKILITETEGIIAVWSDRTDWCGPFDKKQDAVDFVKKQLLK